MAESPPIGPEEPENAMKPIKLMLGRFTFPPQEHPTVADWLITQTVQMRNDTRVDEVMSYHVCDTPITMTRNLMIDVAQRSNVDFLLMLDSDMNPDCYLADNWNKIGVDPDAKPFMHVAFDLLWERRLKGLGPACVGAPYCGPPPNENVYIFRWRTQESQNPNPDLRLEGYMREECAFSHGTEQVAALPTGVYMIDMKAIDQLVPPYFYYEWSNDNELQKASTEDVTFTRDLSIAGVPQFVTWDSWAGHYKTKCVGKPHVLTQDAVNSKFHEAMKRPSATFARPRDELVFASGQPSAASPEPAEQDVAQPSNRQEIPMKSSPNPPGSGDVVLQAVTNVSIADLDPEDLPVYHGGGNRLASQKIYPPMVPSRNVKTNGE